MHFWSWTLGVSERICEPASEHASVKADKTPGNMLLVMNSAQPHLWDWKTSLVKQLTTCFSWLVGPDRLPRATEVRLAGSTAQTGPWKLPAVVVPHLKGTRAPDRAKPVKLGLDAGPPTQRPRVGEIPWRGSHLRGQEGALLPQPRFSLGARGQHYVAQGHTSHDVTAQLKA